MGKRDKKPWENDPKEDKREAMKFKIKRPVKQPKEKKVVAEFRFDRGFEMPRRGLEGLPGGGFKQEYPGVWDRDVVKQLIEKQVLQDAKDTVDPLEEYVENWYEKNKE
jgi:hypothetical protein